MVGDSLEPETFSITPNCYCLSIITPQWEWVVFDLYGQTNGGHVAMFEVALLQRAILQRL